MEFHYSRHDLDFKEHALQRFFEMLPGVTSWGILIGMVLLSFKFPILAAMIIIAFYLHWLLRLFYMTIFLVIAYVRLAVEGKTDWMERVRGLDAFDEYYRDVRDNRVKDLRKKVSNWLLGRELTVLKTSGRFPPNSNDLYQLVIYPVMKEPREIIEPGIRSLATGTFPQKRMIVVLALEERAGEDVKRGAEELAQKFAGTFKDLIISRHPDGVSGEARVKGSNVTHAAKDAAAYFEKNGIPFRNVIVSCFDADTVVSPQYFACLTYRFMVCKDRYQSSFQPIPVYHNNIWEVPGFARVLEMGSSFFQLIEATNPDKLVTFSSHSMSFQALVEVGYWPIDMISDDSAIFWKAYIHYDGKYQVIPMYTLLSMDVVSAPTWWKTIFNVYRQKRRWAWGVENFPIVMRAFLRAKKISLYDKARHGFKLFEGHVAWATWAFLLTVIGWMPALISGREFSSSVVYYSAPRITGLIFNMASLALVITIIVSLCLLPRKRVRNPLIKRIIFAIEWLLIPVIVTFLSALPALDAQTRLMFAKYMDFWVTDKERRKQR